MFHGMRFKMNDTIVLELQDAGKEHYNIVSCDPATTYYSVGMTSTKSIKNSQEYTRIKPFAYISKAKDYCLSPQKNNLEKLLYFFWVIRKIGQISTNKNSCTNTRMQILQLPVFSFVSFFLHRTVFIVCTDVFENIKQWASLYIWYTPGQTWQIWQIQHHNYSLNILHLT